MRYGAIAVMLFLACGSGWASDGTIRIRFKGDKFREINERVEVRDYGVSASREVRRAEARAALSTSPPVPWVYEIERDSCRAGGGRRGVYDRAEYHARYELWHRRRVQAAMMEEFKGGL